MDLSDLRAAVGSKHKSKRVGRGTGSGHGTTAGRGSKGQKARSGGAVHPRFEGGQLPLVKRMPYKRGFKNPFRVPYTPVDVSKLSGFPSGSDVMPEDMQKMGLIHASDSRIKILGDAALDRPLTVTAHAFSANAAASIDAAGGKAIRLGDPA